MALGGKLRNFYKFAAMKIMLPFSYRLKRGRPIKENKVVFIESRSDKMSDNFALIDRALRARGGYDISLQCLRLGFGGTAAYFKNCLKMLDDIADARYIFLNDAMSAYGCLPLRKDTLTIQTWHACGAFKRFGMSTTQKNYGSSEKEFTKYPPYGNVDFVAVSSPEVAPIYEKAMNLSAQKGQKALPIGTSRTDVYFDKARIEEAKKHLLEAVPQAAGRKIFLYAPTFRGEFAEAHIPDALDINKLRLSLPEDSVLLIKHHPFARDKQQIPDTCADFAFDVTHLLSIDDLIMTADLCISDYSSLVFEYSLMDKPMVFFAYDMEEYIDDRGFYYPFTEFCPGPIAKDMDSLIAAINEAQVSGLEKVRAFREKFMSSCDGHATERILELMDTAKPIASDK